MILHIIVGIVVM